MFALFLLVLVLSLAAATQYFAHTFQYHPHWARTWAIYTRPGRYWPGWGNGRAIILRQFSMAGSVGIMTAAFGLILLMALKKHLANSAA